MNAARKVRPSGRGGRTIKEASARTKDHSSAANPSPESAQADGGRTSAGASARTGAAVSAASSIDQLIALNRKRRFVVSQCVRMDNALGAWVRSVCGWQRIPEDATAAVKTAMTKKNATALAQAAKLLSGIRKQDTSDPLAEFVAPMVIASDAGRIGFDRERELLDKTMVDLARTLPAYGWAKSVKGFGDSSFAVLVAEAGDIGAYKSDAALRKRMGIGLAKGSDGKFCRQRLISGDKALNGTHGLNLRRKSVLYVIVDTILRQQWAATKELDEDGNKAAKTKKPVVLTVAAHATGYYGEIYARAKAIYMQRVVDTTALPKGHPDKWTPGRAELAARRRVGFSLLRTLYRTWRAQTATRA